MVLTVCSSFVAFNGRWSSSAFEAQQSLLVGLLPVVAAIGGCLGRGWLCIRGHCRPVWKPVRVKY